jgi:hypothetical protein
MVKHTANDAAISDLANAEIKKVLRDQLGAEIVESFDPKYPNDPDVPDIEQLGRVLFTDYIFAVEITAVLLTIAVVGAVVLARRAGAPIDLEEFPEGTASDLLRARYGDGGTDDAADAADSEAADVEEIER